MASRATFLAALLASFLSCMSASESRTWTDTEGRTIEAELIEKAAGWVQIRRADGYFFRLSIERLSAADREWIEAWDPRGGQGANDVVVPRFQRGERLTFQATSGKKYVAAKVVEFQPDALIVLVSGGVYTIPARELPSDLAARLPPAPAPPPPPAAQKPADAFLPALQTPASEVAAIVPVKKPPPTETEIVDNLIERAPFAFVPSFDEAGPGEIGPQITISGQVFIVTKGRSNVKLGLVIVSVVSTQQVDAVHAYERSHILPWVQDVIRETSSFREHGQVVRALGHRNHLTGRCYDSLPVVASGKTDADGRFEITTILRPPFYLMAKSSRDIGGNQENYRWVVLVDEADAKRPVLLSNDNLE